MSTESDMEALAKRRRLSHDGIDATTKAVVASIDEQFKVAVVDFRAKDAALKFTNSLKTTGFAVLTNVRFSCRVAIICVPGL